MEWTHFFLETQGRELEEDDNTKLACSKLFTPTLPLNLNQHYTYVKLYLRTLISNVIYVNKKIQYMSSSLAGWNFILLCIRNTVFYSPMGRQIGYVYVLNSASL